jgi:hypothetical protein
MQYTISKRFQREDVPESPDLIPGQEFIKLAVSNLGFDDGQVSLKFHVAYMFTDAMAARYQYLDEALVLVVNDVDHQDCFATNFTSDAYVPAPGTRKGSNLITAPPQGFPPPTQQELDSMSGGWINGYISFDSPRPCTAPSIFIYIVLENYFSNVVGIDLFEKKAVYF